MQVVVDNGLGFDPCVCQRSGRVSLEEKCYHLEAHWLPHDGVKKCTCLTVGFRGLSKGMHTERLKSTNQPLVLTTVLLLCLWLPGVMDRKDNRYRRSRCGDAGRTGENLTGRGVWSPVTGGDWGAVRLQRNTS